MPYYDAGFSLSFVSGSFSSVTVEILLPSSAGVAAFIDKYNDRREHSSLDGHTPSDVYFGGVTLGNAA